MQHKQRILPILTAVFLFGMAMGYIAGLWQIMTQSERRIEECTIEE